MSSIPAVFVVGTRAQLIKVAPVIVACERDGISCTLLMTGQHHDTMQDLLQEFGLACPQVAAIPAAEHSTVSSLLRWLPAAYRGVLFHLKSFASPSSRLNVLVHGDTLSTLIGAFAARRCGARVIHVESGLSSGRLFDPFPEEICRRLVFRMTDVAMCPDEHTFRHMQRYQGVKVINTRGNTIVDSVALTGAAEIGGTVSGSYVVVSLHRFQNIYDVKRLRHLVAAIEAIAKKFTVHFVLHPATRARLEKADLLEHLSFIEGVVLHPRMGYRDFLRKAAGAACVLTDGGSNQEELAVLGVPTVVMRAHTERQDGLDVNAIMEADIREGVVAFLLDNAFQHLRRAPVSISGQDGPSDRIAKALAASDTNFSMP